MNGEKMNSFKCSIPSPVPFGATVYRVWTKCCDACWINSDDWCDEEGCMKAEQKKKPFFCSPDAVCHTISDGITTHVLNYETIDTIVVGWGVDYFATQEEAVAALNSRLAKHRKAMTALGYVLNSDGKIIN